MQTLVTVIIPAYNAESTVEAAVRSALCKNACAVEVVAVDDGSSDGTLAVLTSLCGESEQLKVYSKPNGGVSSARNFGLERASGKYIMFLDADDEFLPGSVNKAAEYAETNGADITMFGYETTSDAGKTDFFPPFSGRLKGRQTVFKKIIYPIAFAGLNGYMGSVCSGIFRKSIIDRAGLRFDERVKIAEDTLFFVSYLVGCESAEAKSEIIRIYNLADGSATKKYNPFLEENNRVLDAELKKTVLGAGLPYTDGIAGNRAVASVISLIVNETRHGNPNGFFESAKIIRGIIKKNRDEVKKCVPNGKTLAAKKLIAMCPAAGIAFFAIRKIQAARGVSF